MQTRFIRRAGGVTLNTSTDRHEDASGDHSDLIRIPIAELASALFQRRGWLARVTGAGIILAACISLLTPNEYESTAQLMPPDQQSLTSTSILNSLGASSSVPSLSGALMNARTPASTLIGVLGSRTAQDDIINRFDLLRVYHCKLYADARKTLAKRTEMDEDKKTGIMSIVVTDRDRYRAHDIATAYVAELSKLLNAVNNSAAHSERVFLEERLKTLKTDLDASSKELSEYSSRNATLNPQSEGQSLIEAASRVQGELITAQGELSGLKTQYSDDNVRVREVRARIGELQSQLRKLGGIGEKQDGADLKADQLYPSIRELPILGVTYSDLYRQLNIQESLYEALTKQYELAKVEEAKELPTIKVLDEPDVPEVKSFPSRRIFIVIGAVASAFFGIIWIIACKLWEIADNTGPLKTTAAVLLNIFRRRNAVATE